MKFLAAAAMLALVATPAAADPIVPKGPSVWIQPNGDTYQMLRLWRSGSDLRIYRDEGNYPGDGIYCAWGTLRGGKKFIGKEQRVAPDPLAVRYTFGTKNGKLTVKGLPGKWWRSSVKRFHALVPEAEGNDGAWCRTYKPIG